MLRRKVIALNACARKKRKIKIKNKRHKDWQGRNNLCFRQYNYGCRKCKGMKKTTRTTECICKVIG